MEKRLNIANYILIATLLLITTLEWHFAEWYGLFTPYGTLIMFVGLLAAALLYVDFKNIFRDPVVWLLAGTSAFALLNIIRIRSGVGCLLVVLNMSLMLYLANKVRLTKNQTYAVLIYLAIFFFYWTIDVKGYFKGYNTNYGGLILITGFGALMVLSEFITDYFRKIKNEKKGKWGYAYVVLELFFIALAFNIISWYRSRAALIGLLVLLAIKLLPIKFISNRVVYAITCIFGTLGGVLVSLIYIGFGRLKDTINLTLFYKDLISGREVLWSELWLAFLDNPITGIGSSYEVKTDFMNGMLEVHNGMLDILIVHGIIVFIPIFLLFTKRLLDNRAMVSGNRVCKMAFASIICMMATSFFENFIIVQPFTLVILFMFAIQNGINSSESVKNK